MIDSNVVKPNSPQKLTLVDSHCHLDLEKNDTPERLVAAARAQHVDYCLWVSVDLVRLPSMLQQSSQLSQVFTSVGVHPNSSRQDEPDSATLVKLADYPTTIAIGETGLDYFRSQGDLTWQHERFRTHIRAAREIGKPLIIHMREATEDTLRILREEKATEVGGIMHCFASDWETAQQVMDMGFYVSFSGIITFKQAHTLHQVVQQIPLERVLVETDSPYLAPVPHRGKTNQPAYVRYVAQRVAELKEITLETVAQTTTDNFFRLFQIAH